MVRGHDPVRELAMKAAGWMWERLQAHGELRQAEALRYISGSVGDRLIHETAHGGSLCYEVRAAFATLHQGRARFQWGGGAGRWVLEPGGRHSQPPPGTA